MRYAQRGGLELREGPLAHGFVSDQRWTLGRIKTLIGRLFHVGYTVEGTWKLMRWSCQVPVRQPMNATMRRWRCGKPRVAAGVVLG